MSFSPRLVALSAMVRLVAVLLAGTLIAVVPPAAAAQPQGGSYASPNSTAGAATISFTVNFGHPKKVEDFALQDYSCGGTLIVSKSLNVSSKGKFKFDGIVKSPYDTRYNLKVKGKFTKPRKAKVRVTWGPRGGATCTTGGTIKFVAKKR
jgi:hypothetical protein